MRCLPLILSVVLAQTTRLKAETATDPASRAMEFNVDIKHYPGITTSTTEGSLLDKISGSVSRAFDAVKDAIIGSENPKRKVRLLHPAHYVLPYPYPPVQPLPSKVRRRRPIYPSHTFKRNKAYKTAGEDEEKKNTRVIHYVTNKYGQLIAKELPASGNERKGTEDGDKSNGNYFHIQLQGLVQNSSALPPGFLENLGASLDLKNVVNHAITTQGGQAES